MEMFIILKYEMLHDVINMKFDLCRVRMLRWPGCFFPEYMEMIY